MLFSPWAFPKVLNFTAWSYCIAQSGEAMLCPRPSRMRSDSAHLISIHIAFASTVWGRGGAVAQQHSNFYDVLKQQPGVLIIWFPFSFGCCNRAHWSMLLWSRLSQLVQDASATFDNHQPLQFTVKVVLKVELLVTHASQGPWIQFTKCCTISFSGPSNMQ